MRVFICTRKKLVLCFFKYLLPYIHSTITFAKHPNMRELSYKFIKRNNLRKAFENEVVIRPAKATSHTLISDGNGCIVSATGPGESYLKT